MQILDGLVPLVVETLVVPGVAPAEQMSDVRPQAVVRSTDRWSEAAGVAPAPQPAAQVDVPFDLSAFFVNLEAKRRDDRGEEEREEKKKGRVPEGRSIVQKTVDVRQVRVLVWTSLWSGNDMLQQSKGSQVHDVCSTVKIEQT